MKGQWLDRLKTEKAPQAYATKATKTPDDATEGNFVAFVAYPPGQFQEYEGSEPQFRSFRSVPTGGISENRGGTESRPKPSDPFAIGASWRPLAADYYRHHFLCKICISAGRGHGTRCPAGAELWASYEAASDAAHDTNTNARRART